MLISKWLEGVRGHEWSRRGGAHEKKSVISTRNPFDSFFRSLAEERHGRWLGAGQDLFSSKALCMIDRVFVESDRLPGHGRRLWLKGIQKKTNAFKTTSVLFWTWIGIACLLLIRSSRWLTSYRLKKKHPSCGTLDQKGSKEGQRRGDFIKKAILKRICSLFSLKKERDGQGNPGTWSQWGVQEKVWIKWKRREFFTADRPKQQETRSRRCDFLSVFGWTIGQDHSHRWERCRG